jgi:two-component system cell cycle sensor histidine kinase/response regulator CckA
MLSEQMSNSRQLETMGRLSEMVAHDINNLLSGVLGYSELLLEENASTHLKPLIEELMNSGRRIAGLVRLLLVFRKSEYNPEKLDLNQSIWDLKKYIHHIIGSKIGFDVSLQPELWPVNSDPSYIKRLFLSIAAEAREMVSEDWRFTIETRNISVPDHTIPGLSIDSGRYVRITAGALVQLRFPGLPSTGRTILRDSDLPAIVRQGGGYFLDTDQSGQGFAVQIYLPAAL